MRVRNKPWAKELIEENPQYVVENPESYKGKWQSRFEKSQPLHIEVGSGKGRFIVGMAKQNPDINYIAIELEQSVLVSILEKQLEEKLPNLQILHVNGSALTEYFETGEVDLVYLNFSDPWPKTRHAKRRLTYKTFLATYETILVDNGEVHFKTDNRGLFEYSLVSFSEYGMRLKQVWLDLHASNFEGNVMTEYEEKFSSKGQPIYRVEAQFVK
ncbi:tRNA (guanosine(46)-N7)-methyltransferase TrmB [Vagococcus xieshaowenii]|uniref:tRNA (guanine-N(7)-)-methyltransferase n=1 Tax=Vagococcus xieshaowenii TaxID=2562451 RepID=A0AAJ5EFY3_9ENTE|nr:tRNA (guanosine(46)-N7)-methyltransferase TrmB [Vagococcus xieshaowenii]QCA29036.1 tRNA (guanosine(46)-N7)-methyltransferase TrmB [Vagococcus xieshaowenii]TFZ40988.1 tRNA (guanosine(46)-N7)-methyltransferase TrmB [Vagococcus xieshaowenii]